MQVILTQEEWDAIRKSKEQYELEVRSGARKLLEAYLSKLLSNPVIMKGCGFEIKKELESCENIPVDTNSKLCD